MGGQKYTKFHQHRTMYVKMVAKILLAFFADGTVAEPEFLKNCNRYHKIVLGHHKVDAKLPPDPEPLSNFTERLCMLREAQILLNLVIFC